MHRGISEEGVSERCRADLSAFRRFETYAPRSGGWASLKAGGEETGREGVQKEQKNRKKEVGAQGVSGINLYKRKVR